MVMDGRDAPVLFTRGACPARSQPRRHSLRVNKVLISLLATILRPLNAGYYLEYTYGSSPCKFALAVRRTRSLAANAGEAPAVRWHGKFGLRAASGEIGSGPWQAIAFGRFWAKMLSVSKHPWSETQMESRDGEANWNQKEIIPR